MRRPPLAFTFVALLALALPSALDAQVRRGRAPEQAPRWAPVAIGAHVGWDSRANGQVLGADLRVPVVRSGVAELRGSAEMTWLNNTKEYQYNIDAAYVPAGLRGGLFAGLGAAWRDSIVGVVLGEGRRTYFGVNALAGARTRIGPLDVELGLRWTFLKDTDYQPNTASLGLALPLWSGGAGN